MAGEQVTGDKDEVLEESVGTNKARQGKKCRHQTKVVAVSSQESCENEV